MRFADVEEEGRRGFVGILCGEGDCLWVYD